MLNISKDAIAITNRFFESINMLKEQKKIRGLQTITQKYELNYWNISTLKKEPHKRILKPEYLMYLVRDYDVSANWLLLGIGDMFNKPSQIGVSCTNSNAEKPNLCHENTPAETPMDN